MKPKTLAILALAALVFAVAAVVVNSRNPAYTSASGGQLVFPDLAERVNESTKIVIQTAGNKFTVERAGQGWAVAEKYDYPAKLGLVKQTLIGLVELKTVEAKTAEPSLYPRLEVEPVTVKDAKSALVAVEDVKGQALARLILGKRRYGRGAGSAVELYAREPNDVQSWLVTGTLERTDDVKDWMDREIIKLERDRVHEVIVTPADDKPFALHKEKPEHGDFTLDGVQPEDKVKEPYDVNSIAGGLALLMLEDVLPVKDLKPDAKLLRTLHYKTFDGLDVAVALYQQDGKTWARIAAAFDAQAAPAVAAADKPAAAGSAAGQTAASAEKATGAAKEAEAINARTKDWAYGLAPSDLATFEKKFTDLIEPKTKEKPKS